MNKATKPKREVVRIGKKAAVNLIHTSRGAVAVTAATENNENRVFQFNGGTAKDAGLGNLTIKDRTIKEGDALRTINTKNIKEVKAGGKTYKVNR